MSELNNRIVDPKQRVPLKEKIFFGAADMYGGGAQALIAGIYLVFLVNNGLPLSLAGIIVMIAKLWDAVTDPWMGVISDNTRTKWGRRRPYIFVGGLFVILSFALLFLPLYGISSVFIKFIIYLFAFLFYNTVSTVINVPYSSFSTEISTDYAEKTKVNTIRLIFSMVSSGISSGVPIILVEKLQDGLISVKFFSFIMIFVFGIFYCIPLLLAAVKCKERAALPAEKSIFTIKTFLKPLKVKAFAFLLLFYLFTFSCMDLISANVVYFAEYGINFGMTSFIILLAIMLSYAAMVPIISHFMNKGVPKPLIMRIGIPLYIIGIVLLCLYPKGWPDFPILIICVMIGVGMSGCQMMPWIVFPDVVDVAELKLNDRPTGSFSGLMTFIRKSTSAIAIGISSWVLDKTGFIKPETDYLTGLVTKYPQPESAIWGLRLVIMIPIVIFITFAYICAKKLKLNMARSYKIKEFIELQKANKLNEENMSKEDWQEYLIIQKELF